MNSLATYAFAAGAVATVNPCGFALLPAWFARGMAAHADRPAAERLVRSVLSGGAVSLGFVTIFAIAGVIFASGAGWVGPALPWIGIVLGLGLALVGAGWVTGTRLPGLPYVAACQRVNTRYGAFGFGLSYGLVSISCTLPVFMSVAGLTFLLEDTPSPVGMLSFLAGAASVLTLVSVGGTVSGSGLAQFVQGQTNLLRQLAGALTFLAGIYIVLYWGRLFFDNTRWADAVTNTIGGYGSAARMFVSSSFGIAVLLLGAVTAAGSAWVLFRLGKGQNGGGTILMNADPKPETDTQAN